MNFGIIKERIGNGLFGSTMTWILEILPYLKKNNLYPDWKIDTVCYGMIIPTLIIPKHVEVTSDKVISISELRKKHLYGYSTKSNGNGFEIANQIFFEYFNISSEILEIVESYKEKFTGKTLGIHYRGTDKMNREAEYISKDTVLSNILSFLKKNTYNTLVIITDEQEFINKMSQILSLKEYNIIITNSKKSKNTTPLHFQKNNINDAKDAIVDSLLLSKCDYVIKTSSCLSDWVKIWNPSIKVYNLNKFKHKWFPQCVIPVTSYL
jgi:hypothetical protein